jgi:hypothetical protein
LDLRNFGFLLIGLASFFALSGCDSGGDPLGSTGSRAKNTVGPICANCGPSSGGETGDFGGGLESCGDLEEVAIDEVEAAQVSRDELESRLAQPIDRPFRWEKYDDQNPMDRALEASGYEPNTRLQATLSPTGPFRFQRLTECTASSCVGCWSYIEVSVSVELATMDGAVQAVAQGTAWQAVSDSLSTPGSSPRVYFNTAVDIRDVIGTLRIETPPGGAAHGRLTFGGWLTSDEVRGSVMIFMDVDDDDRSSTDLPSIEGEYFFPLTGSFAE